MIEIQKEGVLLYPTDKPFESRAVLNPAVLQEGENIVMLYRAVNASGISTIGKCIFKGPLEIIQRDKTPLLIPLGEEESAGIEDPRLVKIDDTYLLSYTAFDGMNALGAVAVSSDLETFERYGVIVPKIVFPAFRMLAEQSGVLNPKYARYAHDKTLAKDNKPLLVWDKDLVFFPRRINGKLYLMHRIKPDIQLASGDNLSDFDKPFWEDNLKHFQTHILLRPKFAHEVSYIGGGCPPIETEWGWLVIYHGVCDTPDGYRYSACAALLELDNPEREISRLPYPLFYPEKNWERDGEVNDVCFPSGAAVFSGRLYIYYGAADSCIACASIDLKGLCVELRRFRDL
ncbi:glycoside hydrolase family 130 protein [Pedobacter kyonggii]|uniref:Pesticidal protein Cry7Aa n=1 Tax=Pedobacter kyonggii TaxID=1926871 RepID=A0A4Q9HFC0_9SPHI|nr:pesticidal protein Cry7Aa [Pedobacter kyonggii]TBO43641.1 pesticidal protein Cry7Aa [Pedobacter kyonggii]